MPDIDSLPRSTRTTSPDTEPTLRIVTDVPAEYLQHVTCEPGSDVLTCANTYPASIDFVFQPDGTLDPSTKVSVQDSVGTVLYPVESRGMRSDTHHGRFMLGPDDVTDLFSFVRWPPIGLPSTEKQLELEGNEDLLNNEPEHDEDSEDERG